MQILQQIFLSWLTECEAIEGQAPFEPFQSAHLAAEWERWNAPFNLNRPLIDPIGDEVGIDRSFSARGVEHDLPGVAITRARAAHDIGLIICQIEADRMAFEAMNPSLALFEINRIAGQIPVIKPIAVGVKIESFLADRCGRQSEGTKR